MNQGWCTRAVCGVALLASSFGCAPLTQSIRSLSDRVADLDRSVHAQSEAIKIIEPMVHVPPRVPVRPFGPISVKGQIELDTSELDELRPSLGWSGPEAIPLTWNGPESIPLVWNGPESVPLGCTPDEGPCTIRWELDSKSRAAIVALTEAIALATGDGEPSPWKALIDMLGGALGQLVDGFLSFGDFERILALLSLISPLGVRIVEFIVNGLEERRKVRRRGLQDRESDHRRAQISWPLAAFGFAVSLLLAAGSSPWLLPLLLSVALGLSILNRRLLRQLVVLLFSPERSEGLSELQLDLQTLGAAFDRLVEHQRTEGVPELKIDLSPYPGTSALQLVSQIQPSSGEAPGWQRGEDGRLTPRDVCLQIVPENGSPYVVDAVDGDLCTARSLESSDGEEVRTLQARELAWAVQHALDERAGRVEAPRFPSPRVYVPPTDDELDERVRGSTRLTQSQATDPFQPSDVRDRVRQFLRQEGIRGPLFHRLVEPYDNGYFKKSDGKSTPLGFAKITWVQRRFGFKKDIVSVRHDLDYYRGAPSRRESDGHYLEGQIALTRRTAWSRLETYVLRAFGWMAWNRHARKRRDIAGYGTDAHIPFLPNYLADRG